MMPTASSGTLSLSLSLVCCLNVFVFLTREWFLLAGTRILELAVGLLRSASAVRDGCDEIAHGQHCFCCRGCCPCCVALVVVVLVVVRARTDPHGIWVHDVVARCGSGLLRFSLYFSRCLYRSMHPRDQTPETKSQDPTKKQSVLAIGGRLRTPNFYDGARCGR